ncbi:MAG: Gldg family protein, partial [Dehalococcoidia bacterium]|nr:Gldg family protein [Dehalococcoidia bacterium]
VEDVLQEFEAQTRSFSYEFIDPDREPEVAREYGLQDYGNTVFTSVDSRRNHQVAFSEFLEQDFVTALLIVTGEEQKQVFFLSGHDEKSIFTREEGSAEGFATASTHVQRENYGVSTLHLSLNSDIETFQALTNGEIVGMLVVAGPRRDILDDERELLEEYLEEGGDMLLLLDPDSPQSFRDLAARWGVVVGTDQVIDARNSLEEDESILRLDPEDYLSSVLPVIPDATLENILATGGVTRGLGPTIYPGIVALEPAEEIVFVPDVFISLDPEVVVGEDTNIFGAALAIPSTGDDDFYYPAVAIRAFAALGAEPPERIDFDNPTSLVVFGDSDFASNSYFTTAFNSDIFLNSINWLVGDAPLASIRPKPIAFRDLILDDNQYNLMRYLGWFLLPSVMALAGAVVWWRRR